MTDGAFRMFAEALLDAGYSPLPIVPGRKKPALKRVVELLRRAA